jgi:hypothetical protein
MGGVCGIAGIGTITDSGTCACKVHRADADDGATSRADKRTQEVGEEVGAQRTGGDKARDSRSFVSVVSLAARQVPVK